MNEKELTADILESSNVQIFVVNSSVLVSLLSLPSSSVDRTVLGSRSRSRFESPKRIAELPTSESTAAAVTELFSPRLLVQSVSSTQNKSHQSHSVVSGKFLLFVNTHTAYGCIKETVAVGENTGVYTTHLLSEQIDGKFELLACVVCDAHTCCAHRLFSRETYVY